MEESDEMKDILRHSVLVGKLGIILAIIVVAIIGMPTIKNEFIIVVDGKEMILDVDGLYAEDAISALEGELPGVTM